MLQEIRQRYYYPSMAKYGKKWVEGWEQCAKDKRVPNATITPEILTLPEWDLGPEDAMLPKNQEPWTDNFGKIRPHPPCGTEGH